MTPAERFLCLARSARARLTVRDGRNPSVPAESARLTPTTSLSQVRGSSSQARETLRRHFSELQATATQLLTERLAALLAEVDGVEADSVKPLDECQSMIEHGVGQADELLREGGRSRLSATAAGLVVINPVFRRSR